MNAAHKGQQRPAGATFSKYAYNRADQLRRFATAFPSHAVCDLSKEHLDAFSVHEIADLSAKSRNHYRAAMRQFLQWAVRKDFLTVTHRLREADGLRPEHGNTAKLVLHATRICPVVGIGGPSCARSLPLADWPGCAPLNSSLGLGRRLARARPYRDHGRQEQDTPAPPWWKSARPWRHGLNLYRNLPAANCARFPREITFCKQHFLNLCGRAKVTRKANGLRHAFCSFHFALHSNENLTAAQAGNSPAMIHAHYKGLATKAEAEKWFAVAPSKSIANVIPLPVAASQ